MSHFMAASATIKEVIRPVISIIHSFELNEKLVSLRSSAVAASMVGTASRNENSTAVFLGSPTSIPPIIVAAARETPGTIETD